MNPGLVYDLSVNDYLDFLCAISYNQTLICSFTGSKKPYNCPEKYSLLNFNYPSMTVPNLSGSVTVHRKLKNVGTSRHERSPIVNRKDFLFPWNPILKSDRIGEERASS
ncbi:unnamed protein product [Fraxinus pennsylvanica]|uniref:Uncharacterized protein n=1 Tax=Fraxinus pennsylvanica TaxID=56036 RepID=A0AAD2AE77_9LAMI|nr:unnamed protein product [Fraxinus pennsylvanica]